MLPLLFDPESGKFILPKLPYEYGKNKDISKETDEFHHDKHFNSYITGLNDFDDAMAKMRESGDYSKIRGAMLGFSHNASGAYLHNIYYAILGGNGEMSEDLEIVQELKQDFGDLEKWKAEFKAVAMAARGWAILGLFEGDMRLRHNMVDFHDQQVAYGMQPIIALDTWEHAYYYDQGPERGKYIDAFLASLDWTKINDLFLACLDDGCVCEDGECEHCGHDHVHHEHTQN